MSTISPNRFAFQAPKTVAFGGAGNSNHQINARFSGMQFMEGVAKGVAHSISTPKKHGKLDLMA
jgi:hypothetical protein